MTLTEPADLLRQSVQTLSREASQFERAGNLPGQIMKRLFGIFALISTPLMAQNSAIIATPPQISVAARGEIKVNPDRATIQISVQTKAATAAAAANENAAKQKAVICLLYTSPSPRDGLLSRM